MTEGKRNSLESLLVTLELVGNKVERIASMFLDGLLKFLETTYDWLLDAIRRTREYLSRLFIALGRIIWALGKLLVFYSPILVLLAGYSLTGGIAWLIGGALWFVLITAICFGYGKRVQNENAENKLQEDTSEAGPANDDEEEVR